MEVEANHNIIVKQILCNNLIIFPSSFRATE